MTCEKISTEKITRIGGIGKRRLGIGVGDGDGAGARGNNNTYINYPNPELCIAGVNKNIKDKVTD